VLTKEKNRSKGPANEYGLSVTDIEQKLAQMAEDRLIAISRPDASEYVRISILLEGELLLSRMMKGRLGLVLKAK
jgi:hypothetical protein